MYNISSRLTSNLSTLPGSKRLAVELGECSLISSLLPSVPYNTNVTEPPWAGKESSAVWTDNLYSPSEENKFYDKCCA